MIRYCLFPFSFLANAVPQRFLLWLGDLIGFFFFYLVPFRRSVALENITLAFGKTHAPEQINKIARASYCHYGRSLLEVLRALTWNRSQFRKHLSVKGYSHVEPLIREKKPAFVLLSHMGNFEVLASASSHFDVPIDVIAKTARSRWLSGVFAGYRKKMGIGILSEAGSTLQEVLSSLLSGRFVGVFLDQFMGPPIGIPVQFFGQPAGTVVSLALFTEKRDIPVFPIYCYRGEDGGLHVNIEPAIDLTHLPEDRAERLYEKTQRFTSAIEAQVKAHPAQWIWLHRRWKAFRGEPRWALPKLISRGAMASLLFWVTACTTPGDTPTGIEVPPDPTIAVPKFVAETPTPLPTPTPAMSPEVSPEPTPEVSATPLPTKKKKDKRASAPTPSPVATPTPNPFTIIAPERMPFEVGERLELHLGWVGLPAGRAIMETRRGPEINGRPTLVLWGNVLSSRLVDAIYHVDNTAESYVDQQGLLPYKFLLHMVETHQLKETRVSFDHVQKKAYYWAKRVSEKWGPQNEDRTDELIPGARDMWAALYYARTLNYELNQTQMFYVYENGKNWQIELTPVANELVVAKVGAFQCWKVAIRVKLNNVLSQAGDIVLWLSDDSKRYIVKFDAKIKIGSLYGNLVNIRER